jgi:hypothetical protein
MSKAPARPVRKGWGPAANPCYHTHPAIVAGGPFPIVNFAVGVLDDGRRREAAGASARPGLSEFLTLRVPTFPCFAQRASGQTLSHSDDLRRVPAEASRRWNIAPIERRGGRSRWQRGELVQDRPEPLGAVGRHRQHPVFARPHPTRPQRHQISAAVPTAVDRSTDVET